MVLREIRHNLAGFTAAALSVLLASAGLVTELGLLARHDRNTEAVLAAARSRTAERVRTLQADVQARAAALEDEMRKIMKGLGFNVLILPRDQDLTDFYAAGYASRFMPEAYVKELAASRIVTVRHLLPILERKVKWPERNNRTILVVGTRGEVPLAHRKPKRPLRERVAPGDVVMGFELWNGLGLKVGDIVRLLGREFTVRLCHPERGTKDDITVWLNLAVVQELLDLPGKINAILALQCRCAWADLAKVRAEIGRILPDTQVKELHTRALARAEARERVRLRGEQAVRRAKREGRQALAQQQTARAGLRRRMEHLAAVTIPVMIGGACGWVGFLCYLNVRRRRGEIAILRAIGVGSGAISRMILLRSVGLGLLGAAAGYPLGLLGAGRLAEEAMGGAAMPSGFQPLVFAAVVAGGAAVSALAAWPPAMSAAREDPACVLQQEGG
jgi:hypothetical protein